MPRDIAVDLGTLTTQVFLRNEGIVREEPTVVAIAKKTRKVLDIGHSGIYLKEQSDNEVELVWPIKAGAIANSEIAFHFLSRLVRPVSGRFGEKTRLIVCIPSSITPMERREVRQVAKRVGVSNVYLIESVVAAALGSDLPIHEPVGTLILVAGAGVTEAALLSLGCMVSSTGRRWGCKDIDTGIKQFLRREYSMAVTDRIAEDVKFAASEISGLNNSMMIEAAGSAIADGSTITAILDYEEIHPTVNKYCRLVSELIKECIIGASPDLIQDLFNKGMHLAGGGALLGCLESHLSETFNVQMHIPKESDKTVVMGAGKCLEAIDSLKTMFVQD